MEGSYRSFSIMNNTSSISSGSGQRRRRSNPITNSRRSSTDSGSKFWESGNSSGAVTGNGSASFFAMSASFVNSLQTQAHHVDTGACADSSGMGKRWAPKPKRSSSRDDCKLDVSDRTSSDDEARPNDQWTASERAEIVTQDRGLHALLLAEVERSGVVTAAGYRAVHQKFLYSDVVDQEMNRCRINKSNLRKSRQNGLRSSRFGGLVKSAFSPDNCDQHMFKKRSSGSDASRELQLDADLGADNLAPRRSQVIHLTPEQRGAILQDLMGHQQARPRRTESFLASIENMDRDDDHNMSHEDSFMASLEKLDEGSGRDQWFTPNGIDETPSRSHPLCSQAQDMLVLASDQNDEARGRPSSRQHQREDSNDSLVLQDIFDGADGSELFSSIISEALPKKKTNASSDGLTATSSTAMSRLDTLSGRFSDVNFDPEPTDVDTNSKGEEEEDEELKTSVYSFTDKCGWLPWPEKEGGSNSSGHSVEDFAESFRSSCQGEDAFLPWPGSLRSSGRARAA